MSEHGIVRDMDEKTYHSHPALSASNMKKLLPPYVPALFKHEMENGQPSRPVLNFGSAAHAKLLGIGRDTEVVQKTTVKKERVDADTYDTKSASEDAERIIAEGKTPILRKEIAVIDGMVSALRADPLAAKLLAPAEGIAEASVFWEDNETGVPLRARFDFLREPVNGRLLCPDYKTAHSADPREFASSSAKFRYPLSAAHYIDGLLELGYAEDIEFLFIAQMKTPPYLCSVIGIKSDDLERGRALKRKAIATYQACTASNTWPGWTSEVHYPDLPVWWNYEVEEITA